MGKETKAKTDTQSGKGRQSVDIEGGWIKETDS